MIADMTSAPDFSFQGDIDFLGPDRAEKLDVYLPGARFQRPLPAVLLIHGGGWRIGDKASERERNIGSNLAANGYAVFSINYLLNIGEKTGGEDTPMRLMRVAWPQSLYDCKSGLRFLRREAARFGIVPGRIAVMGGSAGGSFSMLLGFTSNDAELNRHGLYTEERNDVSCIINFYGPTDVRDERRRLIFAGATEEQTTENARIASPLTHLVPGLPPMLIAQGTADALVPVDVSRDLARRYEALGNDYWYIEIAGAPHTFHLQPAQMDLRPVVLEFLKKHLGEPELV